ncbi:MAG: FAD-binding protein [Desulfohalobiaceae bacterium]|nr:FAD-binding protein [Desulfohalobiaceae bacterium]
MISKGLIQEFIKALGQDNVLIEPSDLHVYSYDAAVLDPVVPGAVLSPGNSQELGRIVKLCNENRTPLNVRGSGTNLSGGTVPAAQDSVVVLTRRLNKILEINTRDLYARVQPGVITADFAAQVAQQDLFYPPDPGSQTVSTLGGNVAENAGGLRGLKYGVTKDYLQGVTFFDVNGELIHSGSRTIKCATGLNLTGLMAGSEGTLGVMNEIILKLIPPPKASRALLAVFDSLDKGSETVSAIIAEKIIPCTLEFLDNFTIKTVEDFRRAGLPTEAEALLLIEVDGHPEEVREEARKIQDICSKIGAVETRIADSAREKANIWQARRDALPALARLKPTTILEDATVPRSRIPEMVKGIKAIGDKYDLTIGTFGHAGDGNLHPTIVTDRRDKQEFERVEKAIAEIFAKALSLDGTLSGEHGIGLAKARFMEQEVGRASLAYSRALKKGVDPNNILNPGKMF